MAGKKQLTLCDKTLILDWKKKHISVRAMAKQLNVNESSVRRFLAKFEIRRTLDRKYGSGRPRCTSVREDRLIKRLCLRDRFATSSQIRRTLEKSVGSVISAKTVQRRLNEVGLRASRPAKKPLLTQKMKKTRLEWAKTFKNWTVDDWSQVIFSDESKFNLFGSDGNKYVRRRKGERYNENCTLKTVKHSPYVMVWGCITYHGVGQILILRGSVNAEKYLKVIKEGAYPTILEVSPLLNQPLFQDDNARCHRATVVSKFSFEVKILLNFEIQLTYQRYF